MIRRERLRAAIPLVVMLGIGATASCGSEEYANVQVSRTVAERDDGNCHEGAKVRFGGPAVNGGDPEEIRAVSAGKDETTAEDYYRLRIGRGDAGFLIRREVGLQDRYNEFSNDKIIVTGEIEMGENPEGQEECLLAVHEIREVLPDSPN